MNSEAIKYQQERKELKDLNAKTGLTPELVE